MAQYLIPGGPFIDDEDDTTDKEYMLPGYGFFNGTAVAAPPSSNAVPNALMLMGAGT